MKLEKTATPKDPSGTGRTRSWKITMQPYHLDEDRRLRHYARKLEADPAYQVLRRLPRLEEMWMVPIPAAGPDIVIGIIDTETTGLTDDASLIEIAVSKLSLVDGQLADLTVPICMLDDPCKPLPDEIVRITGLTDADLFGEQFDEALLRRYLDDVDVLVAFNARFDAMHLRRRFPWMLHPWVCARQDYDWPAAGFEGRSQADLLASRGHFYPVHRAASDVWALAVLVSLPAPDGRTIAAHLVDRGRAIEARIMAHSAPFSVKDALKARGYRWNASTRVWTIDVSPTAAQGEMAWLRTLHPVIRPRSTIIDWFDRHIS